MINNFGVNKWASVSELGKHAAIRQFADLTEKQASLKGKMFQYGARLFPQASSFIKNTYNPGFGQVRQALKGVKRVKQNLQNASGRYYPSSRTVVIDPKYQGQQARQIRRHELMHAMQHSMAGNNSLHGYIGKHSFGPRGFGTHSFMPRDFDINFLLNRNKIPGHKRWKNAFSNFLAETQAFAAEHRSLPGQLRGAANFIFNPRAAAYYSRLPSYGGWRYGAIHRPLANFSRFATGGSAIGGTGELLNSAKNHPGIPIHNHDRRQHLRLKRLGHLQPGVQQYATNQPGAYQYKTNQP